MDARIGYAVASAILTIVTLAAAIFALVNFQRCGLDYALVVNSFQTSISQQVRNAE